MGNIGSHVNIYLGAPETSSEKKPQVTDYSEVIMNEPTLKRAKPPGVSKSVQERMVSG
jgi:hypothetical protein